MRTFKNDSGPTDPARAPPCLPRLHEARWRCITQLGACMRAFACVLACAGVRELARSEFAHTHPNHPRQHHGLHACMHDTTTTSTVPASQPRAHPPPPFCRSFSLLVLFLSFTGTTLSPMEEPWCCSAPWGSSSCGGGAGDAVLRSCCCCCSCSPLSPSPGGGGGARMAPLAAILSTLLLGLGVHRGQRVLPFFAPPH